MKGRGGCIRKKKRMGLVRLELFIRCWFMWEKGFRMVKVWGVNMLV